jgi:hypothetical protein
VSCDCPLRGNEVQTQEELETLHRTMQSQSIFESMKRGATSVMSGNHENVERFRIETAGKFSKIVAWL